MQKHTGKRQNTRAVGSNYETIAADYLRGKGYRILARNYRIRQGEIDLIASKNQVLVFFEVKYRRTDGCGAPSEAVMRAKQRRISRVAVHYLVHRGLWERAACRFDVIEVQGNRLRHIEDAFTYIAH